VLARELVSPKRYLIVCSAASKKFLGKLDRPFLKEMCSFYRLGRCEKE
jgi:hypothetical protein